MSEAIWDSSFCGIVLDYRFNFFNKYGVIKIVFSCVVFGYFSPKELVFFISGVKFVGIWSFMTFSCCPLNECRICPLLILQNGDLCFSPFFLISLARGI